MSPKNPHDCERSQQKLTHDLDIPRVGVDKDCDDMVNCYQELFYQYVVHYWQFLVQYFYPAVVVQASVFLRTR